MITELRRSVITWETCEPPGNPSPRRAGYRPAQRPQDHDQRSGSDGLSATGAFMGRLRREAHKNRRGGCCCAVHQGIHEGGWNGGPGTLVTPVMTIAVMAPRPSPTWARSPCGTQHWKRPGRPRTLPPGRCRFDRCAPALQQHPPHSERKPPRCGSTRLQASSGAHQGRNPGHLDSTDRGWSTPLDHSRCSCCVPEPRSGRPPRSTCGVRRR